MTNTILGSDALQKNKVRRVAFLCDFFSSLGGTENYNLTLIKSLVALNIKVRVYIAEKPERADWIDVLDSLGVPVKISSKHRDVENDDLVEPEFVDKVTGDIRSWRPNLIYTHPFKKMAIAWLEHPDCDTSIPIVATEWTVPSPIASHWFDSNTKKHANSVKAYIATCEAAASGIRNYHSYKGKIFTIPHILSTSPEFLSLPQYSTDRKISVGCIARLSPEKGVAFLIGAWYRVKQSGVNIKLHIYGHGYEENILKELTKCLGVDDLIVFEGTFPPGQVKKIAKKHDFFIQPSLFESIPTSSIELMGCGRTLIATNAGGLPELIRDNLNGIMVDIGSTDQIADAVIGLATDRRRLQKLSVAAHRTVSRKYRQSEVILKILEAYNFAITSAK